MKKNAIVTGGTKGIGLRIAQMLLNEGYFVTVTYAHDETSAKNCTIILKHISDSFEVVKADQADKTAMRHFTKSMIEKNNIDCLVCNAGTTLRKNLTDMTDNEWEHVMQVNVNSNVFLIRDLYSKLKNNSRIILIGSMMGIYPHGMSLAYGVTKSAIHAMAKNIVKFFEGTGTTVNVIAPGFVETEWQKNKPQEIRSNICNKTAVHRFATVDEIANAVKFCINNAFVNGSIIEVSGGYSYK